MKESLTITQDDLPDMARRTAGTLASILSDEAKVLFLEGDLGAGKTTFAKEIAQVLGIDRDDVHSPTFILKKEYKASHPFFKKLIHIDAYRFENKSEADVLKLADDMKDPYSLIVIEWPSKMNHKNADMVMMFSVIDDDTREVEVTL